MRIERSRDDGILEFELNDYLKLCRRVEMCDRSLTVTTVQIFRFIRLVYFGSEPTSRCLAHLSEDEQPLLRPVFGETKDEVTNGFDSREPKHYE
jgi:hypothetical protein